MNSDGGEMSKRTRKLAFQNVEPYICGACSAEQFIIPQPSPAFSYSPSSIGREVKAWFHVKIKLLKNFSVLF